MAVRKVFYILNNKVVDKDFVIQWNGGFSLSQKTKNVEALHLAISNYFSVQFSSILEVSTKSSNPIGVELSSFNLELEVDNKKYNVESAYQSSKVFRTILGDKQYSNLINKSPYEAKKIINNENHANLIAFRFLGITFPITPKHLFYDWIYIKALNQIPCLDEILSNYEYFTDIEFNPEKSLNCQARSLTLFIWLNKNSKLNDYLNNPKKYYKNVK